MSALVTPSLLITDDDRDFRETLRTVFEPRGYQTFLAADGEQAVEIVRRQRIHIILLDMHMPRLNGIDTIRRVRELYGRLPCILMSAALDPAIEREARAAEAFEVLAKPISFPRITGVVREALAKAYATGE